MNEQLKLHPTDMKIIKGIEEMPKQEGLRRIEEFNKSLDERFVSTFNTGDEFQRDRAFSSALNTTLIKLSDGKK